MPVSGCRMSTDRLSCEIAEAGFCADTPSALTMAQRENWYLFGTREEAVAFGENQVLVRQVGALGLAGKNLLGR